MHGVGGRPASAPLTQEEKEDICKWREERRKNYPTSANVNRKASEIDASKERGELLPETPEETRANRRKQLAKVLPGIALPIGVPPTERAERLDVATVAGLYRSCEAG